MCWDLINETFTSIGTVGAVVVGMFAINRANKNNREQILTNKLEELLESITVSGKYFGILKNLYNDIENYRNQEKIKTLLEYYEIRDAKFPKEEREKLFDKLSRIEILAKCYTNSNLKKEILEYEDMMYSFTDLVSMGGSIPQQIKWKNGLPSYEEFTIILRNIEKKIMVKITVK
ncbi:hypothetical protein [Flavobacterium sp.]|uniref:hypothetical protein n=1 Tax=Flavobacterium sp. TaxID=239 RepID=UPI00286D710D|nr:hypothetical protein [Flavobacterium sp.]